MDIATIPPEYRRVTSVDWKAITETATGLYVEVGTFHGASASAASQNADRVVTIDTVNREPKVWDTESSIVFFHGDSAAYAKELTDSPIDTLFIDGDHSYEGVMLDCVSLIPRVKRFGIILFHDYNETNPDTGVFLAVNEYLATIPHKSFGKVPGSHHLLKVQKL